MVKYSWVWLCFLSLICFLMSCTGKKTQLNDGAPLVSNDTLIPVIQPEQEPEEEKVEAPTRVDELFDAEILAESNGDILFFVAHLCEHGD